MEIKINIEKTIEKIKGMKFRSIWDKAVQEDASWLLESLTESYDMVNGVVAFESITSFEYALKQGAYSWKAFSEGGSALIYDKDIAKHYCTKTELKITHNGEKAPNKRESWLDVQARALWQANMLIVTNLVTE